MAIAAAVDFGTLSVGVSLVLAEYYLWCDHRAKGEAAEITEAAQREGPEAIQWCGGVYSSEWGFSKLLHWLRHNPDASMKPTYDELYALYSKLYFTLGRPGSDGLGDILPN